MRKTAKMVVTLVVALLLLLTAACAPAQQEKPSAPTVGWGILEIRVTDPGPANVQSAVVYLSNLEVHRVSANTSDWIPVLGAPPSFDLMDVIGVEQILGAANVTAGSFTEIRMDVSKVTGVTSNNTAYTAEVPSDKLKIVGAFNVGGGNKTTLTLDFDGEKSLIMTGQGKFLFKPVVKLLVNSGGQTAAPKLSWGIVEIRATDPGPANVKSAVVYLSNLEVHKVSANTSDNTSDNTSSWIPIIGAPASFDLMNVIGVEQILGSANITAGSFTQIRMDVSKVTGVTTDNISYTAEVPSDKLRIVGAFNVGGGNKTTLTLDFDGEKSLIMTGQGKFLFKPVVKLLVNSGGETTQGQSGQNRQSEGKGNSDNATGKKP